MQSTNHLKIEEIKFKIECMLKERQLLESNNTTVVSPSKYWSDFCSCFEYMLELSEKSFAKLRLHTYHLTGDNYQLYYFGDPEAFLKAYHWKALVDGVPTEYVLNEPEDGIGFRYSDGRFLSSDIARFQRVVSSLYRHHVLTDLSSSDAPRLYVLEVGGGYGGLGHHLSRIIKNTTYIIVDLPETLLYSASYLTQHNPEKKLYLYDSSTFSSLIGSTELAAYDFLLLPNYQLHALANARFDLVINVASLQEMRTPQAETYLDFIRETCRGVFYSWNEDHQPRNKELVNLSELLRQRFELQEVTRDNLLVEEKRKFSLRKTLGEKLIRGFSSNPPIVMPAYAAPGSKEYICRPLPLKRAIE